MNIAKIFCQSFGVTSHAKTFLMVCHFRTDSRSNEFGIRSGYPFQTKLPSVRMAWAICWKKRQLFERLVPSVRTAMAIRAKKKFNCRPFERLKLSVQR